MTKESNMQRIWTALLVVTACLLGTAAVRADEKPVTHRVLGCDKGKVTIVNAKGEVEWQADCPTTAHDVVMLPNGNVVIPISATTLVELSPDKQIVWKHESKPKDGYSGHVEIHGFERLKNGLTVIGETGNTRIIEVDKDDRIVLEVPYTVDHEDTHRDNRMLRKLDNGHYLVCHEGDGAVREYDGTGKVVWSYKLDLDGRPAEGSHQGHGTHVFGAIRLKNGNTLIAAGDGNRVIEVTPDNKVVWKLDYNELPGIRLYWVTTLQVLPNGHIVIGNTHAGPDNPQLIEVTRDKQVVWTFKNFDIFGNDLCATQLLDIKGKVIR